MGRAIFTQAQCCASWASPHGHAVLTFAGNTEGPGDSTQRLWSSQQMPVGIGGTTETGASAQSGREAPLPDPARLSGSL